MNLASFYDFQQKYEAILKSQKHGNKTKHVHRHQSPFAHRRIGQSYPKSEGEKNDNKTIIALVLLYNMGQAN